MKKIILAALITLILVIAIPGTLHAEDLSSKEFIVFGVHNSLNMGNPGEKSYRDFFINIGSDHGAKNGAMVQVYRRAASYDLLAKKLYQELTYPIAELKVIHTQEGASIARLVKLYSPDDTPTLSPQMVMVGDVVELK